jgi:hypothetical protein
LALASKPNNVGEFMKHNLTHIVTLSVLLALAFSLLANAASSSDELVTYSELREVCASRSATRNAYFGDLHIHTGYSYDAIQLGIKNTPADAYRFAKGESIPVPPFDDNGIPQSTAKLKTPLDFAAVTDHAEFFGEFSICTDASSEVYQTNTCKGLRGQDFAGYFEFIKVVLDEDPQRISEICGKDGTACTEAARSPWKATQKMAEAAYDRSSACKFTTFVAYEYTGTTNSNNIHRNVIFRNAIVPDQAISYIEAPTAPALWAQLTQRCHNELPGCDVLAIPHNSNISAGAMFASFAAEREMAQSAVERAAIRNAMEPIMEIFQHKGNSECFNGLPGILGQPDELCNMEQVRALGERTDRSGTKQVIKFCKEGEVGRRGFSRFGCISKNDFFRSVLLTGLQDEAVIGVNSYRLGTIASTDTHLGTSGATDEKAYLGHLVTESTLKERLAPPISSPQILEGNPGGLAGIWAVENSRDALFNAMQQREVFGTSGTRIRPRLFAGWDIADEACELASPYAHGYKNGVPMGAQLSSAPQGSKVKFLITAIQDPNAAPLQKLQIIKGWVDAQGNSNNKVIDVVGTENNEGSIDLETGVWGGSSASTLCAVYEDSEFDPSQSAYYYMRAVEVPTLRWSWAQCVLLPVKKRPTQCNNSSPKTIQEMAWTSPIWYSSLNEREK